MEFYPNTPRLWFGRYSTRTTQSGSFHVREFNNGWWPVIDWSQDGAVGECHAVDDGDKEVTLLVDAVNNAKSLLGGRSGGKFMIDEYGEVLVPSNTPGDTRKMWVGSIDLSKPFSFENPFDDSDFDLSEDFWMTPGDEFELPYVGMKFTLNAGLQICQQHQTPLGTLNVFPRVQDQNLIAELDSLGGGGCSFIVNPFGIVARKILLGGSWTPVYVGRIDLSSWF